MQEGNCIMCTCVDVYNVVPENMYLSMLSVKPNNDCEKHMCGVM